MIHFEYVNDTGKRIADIIRKENLPFEGEAIVFVGAMGICVRKILPVVNDKYADPAVICIDSTGKYIIPVLSGHVGGANSLARSIASVLGGEAIITTQSDNMGLWPLDTLAADFRWTAAPIPRQEMNACIAAFVNKQPTALVIECDDAGAQHLKQTLPPHVSLFDSCEAFSSLPASQKSAFSLLIVVSPFERSTMLQPGEPYKHQLRFYPRCLHLGVGCQKKAPETVADIVLEDVARMGYAIHRWPTGLTPLPLEHGAALNRRGVSPVGQRQSLARREAERLRRRGRRRRRSFTLHLRPVGRQGCLGGQSSRHCSRRLHTFARTHRDSGGRSWRP